jgi:hypothetical protein
VFRIQAITIGMQIGYTDTICLVHFTSRALKIE